MTLLPGIVASGRPNRTPLLGGSGEPPPDPPGETVPLQTVLYADVGEVNPFNVERDTPFVQGVGVPTNVDVPQGVYGVRIGDSQLAAQARTVKHRPDGNAVILRVEGVWPSSLTTAQTISLTALPPDVTSAVTVSVNAGNGMLVISHDGSPAQSIEPWATTSAISGSKPSNLKGSNTSASYIPSISFHEWHVTRPGGHTSVDARFQTLTVEEDTSILTCYLARGRGVANPLYEFQMRLIVYKYEPWVRWEYTTFKHFDVNLPSESGSMDALAWERLTIIPASGSYTAAKMKSTTDTSIAVESDAFGDVTGDLGASTLADTELNAVAMTGTNPISWAVRDLMGSGPSAIYADTSLLIIDLWGEHTNEVFDCRGTGKAGEVQADSSDYNADPRGNARTWEGFFVLEDNLPLAQQFAARDDLWFMTPQALEDSKAFGPLKASAGTTFAAWWKRINALARAHEVAAERHKHYGYAQYGLLPAVIPSSVDTGLDRYVAREPMHSGRYGQSKDGHTHAGSIIAHLLTGDRTRLLRGMRTNLLLGDINGQHGMLFGTDYAGASVNGIHRRYRDPWTGRSDDPQYVYANQHYTTYWAGGSRRSLERAQKICDALADKFVPYSHRVWAFAERYMHSHSSTDLTALNAAMASDISDSADSWPPPSILAGHVAGMMWDNFRYGHNTIPAVRAVYEATGDEDEMDALADAHRTSDFSFNGSTWDIEWSTFGQHTTPFHGLAHLLLEGYSSSQVSSDAISSMDFWIGQYIQAGTLRNHNATLPPGDPDTYDWDDVQTYWNDIVQESPGYQRVFGPIIASWYAS